MALRYAMWTLAATVADKFMDLKDHFYHRARKYMETDALKGHGEHIISIAHAHGHHACPWPFSMFPLRVRMPMAV